MGHFHCSPVQQSGAYNPVCTELFNSTEAFIQTSQIQKYLNFSFTIGVEPTIDGKSCLRSGIFSIETESN